VEAALAGSYDIAVIGSGFAGSLMSMICRRMGRSVVLIDKCRHPRVVIGESSTPLTNLLLEELVARYDLPALKPLAKWGSWQNTYPEIGCGLKRGFTFYHHGLDSPITSRPGRDQQLLVAASPNDRIADTHWYRADFDHFLVRQAQQIGVDYFDETQLTRMIQRTKGFALEGVRGKHQLQLSAKFVIDASGPRGLLHRALGIGEIQLPNFPATQAIYNHFTGVERLDRLPFGANTREPPYPIDDAAVHHVFDGGWVWVLRFDNGVTSAGVAAVDKVASELNFASSEAAWKRLLSKIPALREQFRNARAVLPFTHIPRLSFRSVAVSGPDWALLPSAAGFVDPLLSTGFPLTLLGIARLAAIIERDWDAGIESTALRQYAIDTQTELIAASNVIAALYANMDDFAVFSALSLIYFAAVSYTETARRLGKAHLARGFLMHDHPVFGPAMRDLLDRAQQPRSAHLSTELIADIRAAIEPWNVAGLGDPRRENWYPVDPEDLLRSAAKVGSSQEEILDMLKACGVDRVAQVLSREHA
jgi:tetracycline 7-halogenase / FADH2 O2-dependent halogenase